jgi:hypothetical protein
MRVLDDFNVGDGDQSFFDHLVEDRQRALDFLFRINDGNHHRQIG